MHRKLSLLLLFLFLIPNPLLASWLQRSKNSPSYLIRNRIHYVGLKTLLAFYGGTVHLEKEQKWAAHFGKTHLLFTPFSKRIQTRRRSLWMHQEALYLHGEIYLNIGSVVDLLPPFLSFQASKPIHLPQKIRSILIDPGHGGKDHGAKNKWYSEKTLNLTLAKLLLRKLKELGFQVRLTRYSDVYLHLEDRITMSHRFDPDLFLSLHGNASKEKKVKGFELFILKDLKHHHHFNSTKSFFPKERYYMDYLNQNYIRLTKKWAKNIESQLKTIPSLKSRGIKHEAFRLLRHVKTPSLILEVGFVTNPGEALFLKKKANLVLIANKIASAFASLRSHFPNRKEI